MKPVEKGSIVSRRMLGQVAVIIEWKDLDNFIIPGGKVSIMLLNGPFKGRELLERWENLAPFDPSEGLHLLSPPTPPVPPV